MGPIREDTEYAASWTRKVYTAGELYDMVSPAVVEIVCFDGNGNAFSQGSGFFIDDAGTLVTNFHVIEGATSVAVNLAGGTAADVRYIVDYDSRLDLAILYSGIRSTDYLPLASGPITAGDPVYAMGSPLGLTGSFTNGIISYPSRDIEGVDYIQTTAPISSGNSGGPLINAYGEVVGINTMVVATGQNLNFAVSIKQLNDLDRSGRISMEDFYAATVEVPGEEGFYGDTAYAEEESNDTVTLSDYLTDEEWIAGEVVGEDIDWFYFEVEQTSEVYVILMPFYREDNDYALCAVCRLDEEEGMVIIATLEEDSDSDGNVFQDVTLTLDEGYYFVVVTDDSYPYNEPIYYALCVDT